MGIDKDNYEQEEEFERRFILPLKETKKELNKYRRAYLILMEYWDSLPDEEKPEIDRRLKELDL